MKVNNKAHKSIVGMDKEATIVESTIDTLIDTYGFKLVLYVTNQLIYKERNRLKLEKDILKKEKELEELKQRR